MSARRPALVVVASVALLPLPGWAQGSAPDVRTPPEPSVAAAGAPGSAPAPQGFTYNANGRRDPFVSLLARGADPGRAAGAAPPRPSGLAGLAADEITLRGTAQGRQGFVAIVQGADTKQYVVRAGDRLFDGVVRAIAPDAIVILQEVSDPLSRERFREVRKALRQTEEAR